MAEPTFNHLPVTSSNIASIAHDPGSRTLRVRFKSGAVYDYAGVDAAKFTAMKSAPSVGSFLHQHIKGTHAHKAVP